MADVATYLGLGKSRSTRHVVVSTRISQLEAQISEMEVLLWGAAYGLSQRLIVSQTEGFIQHIYFRQGEYVPAATPVLTSIAIQSAFAVLISPFCN
jgi:multidrug resistance efflux pump